MKPPEQSLMNHLGTPTGDGFEDWIATTNAVDELDGLTEQERSRVRLLRIFNIATIEGLNREIALGASAPEAVCLMASVMGMAAAGITCQAITRKARRDALKALVKLFESGAKEYYRKVDAAEDSHNA